MGCFLHCFGSSTTTKPRRNPHRHHRIARDRLEQPAACSVQGYSKTVELNIASQEVQAKPLEQIRASPKKRVTFDVNVQTYEPDEVSEISEEGGGEERALVEKLSQSKSRSAESSVTSKVSYPTNHRYHNCSCSDDEDGAMEECWDSDLTDGDEDDGDMGEEYDEVGEDIEDGIVYSRSRNGGANQVFVEEVESPISMYDKDVKSIGSNPNVRNRSVYVHSVLNPVENLTQWKTVKAKRAPPLVSQKENLVLNQGSRTASFGAEEAAPKKKLNQEIVVDASLSNWLGSSGTTPVSSSSKGLYAGTPERSSSEQGSNSVVSHEDRPILGALTVEELKQFSASFLPRKSHHQEMTRCPL